MTKATHLLVASSLALGALTIFAGCETEPPQTPAAKQSLEDSARASMDKMFARDAGLRPFVENSYAYAIFPSVAKGGLIAGGATGRGEVFRGNQFLGYAEMNQASVGAQIGGQQYAELVVFQNEDALNRFEQGRLSFEAGASAVALKAGASVDKTFRNGVAVFTMPEGGLMADASVGGQQFTFQPYTANQATYREETHTTTPPAHARPESTGPND